MEPTWKAASFTAVPALAYMPLILMLIRPMDTAIMARYTNTSEFFSISLNRFL